MVYILEIPGQSLTVKIQAEENSLLNLKYSAINIPTHISLHFSVYMNKGQLVSKLDSLCAIGETIVFD